MVLTPEDVAHFVLVLTDEVVYVLWVVVVKVSGQGVLVMPEVVMNDVIEVVSGQGLCYVDFSSVIQEDVSGKTVSLVKGQRFILGTLPVQGVT